MLELCYITNMDGMYLGCHTYPGKARVWQPMLILVRCLIPVDYSAHRRGRANQTIFCISSYQAIYTVQLINMALY